MRLPNELRFKNQVPSLPADFDQKKHFCKKTLSLWSKGWALLIDERFPAATVSSS